MIQHPVDLLLAEPAANADAIVAWCRRTTGAQLPSGGRTLAADAVKSKARPGVTLRQLAAIWNEVPGLQPLAFEVQHVAAPAVEIWYRNRQ